MPAKRKLTMRQLRQMLRLAHDGASSREIGRVLGIARSTVQDNLKRAAAAGLSWPLARRAHRRRSREPGCSRGPGSSRASAGARSRTGPRWSIDLKKPGVTMMVLWEEYREVQPDGYGYSRFCELFRGFERRLHAEHAPAPCRRRQGLRRLLRQEDRRSSIPHTGVVREAEIFVAVLGASSLTYRRGDLDPVAAGLDRRACAHVPLLRRRAAPGRARQPEVRASTRPRSTTPRSTAATA